MKLRKLVRASFASLLTNKLRTFLATLGIVIGVSAVIVMIGIGKGAEAETKRRISSLGSNLLFVRPGFGRRRAVRSAQVTTLLPSDATAIAALGPDLVTAAVPETSVSAQVKYFNRNKSTTILGTTPEYFPARNFGLQRGRTWTESEGRVRKRVCVIGQAVLEELFGEGEAVGRTIKIQGVAFEVLGVLEAKGSGGFMNPDDQILAPLATVQKRLGAGKHLRGISVQSPSTEALDEAAQRVDELLRARHRIPAGRDPDFDVRNQADLLRTRAEVAETFTLLLAGIALVSLIVGGIGIMNIMLVSVAERTKEIGIRKAIGARPRDILSQFLIESIAICLVGGLLGIGLGLLVSYGFATLGGTPVEVSGLAIGVSFAFASATGLFFGLYPARKAAKMSPIDALRHE